MNPETENDNFAHRTESLSADVINILLAILLVTGILLGLYLYAKRWKEKNDAATCVMNIRNFQTLARSLSSMSPDNFPGQAPVDMAKLCTWAPVPIPICPARGHYTVHGCYSDPPGTVFLRCSHPRHVPTPAQSTNW